MKLVRVMLGVVVLVSLAPVASAGGIQGDYLEARSCDVYTGPCFSNSEFALAGQEAILAWKIKAGTYEGVDLSGRSVVAVVKASSTLGDLYNPEGNLKTNPLPARSVVMVEESATAEQRAALVRLAKSMAPDLLKDVTAVWATAIELEINTCPGGGCARLNAGETAKIKTRCISDKDHLCGNEEAFYPPLAMVDKAHPAVAVTQEFAGKGLNSTWRIEGKRGAFLATFGK